MSLPAGIPAGPLMMFVICACGEEFAATGPSEQVVSEFAEWDARHEGECAERGNDSMN